MNKELYIFDESHIGEKYASECTEYALEKIRTQFEESEDPYNNLPYHDSFHTKSVIARTTQILSVLNELDPDYVSNKDIQLGIVAASFHDIVQSWSRDVVSGENYSVTRRLRHIEQNENDSAQEALAYMDGINQNVRKEIFSDTDKKAVQEAILTTIPSFNFELGTVFQPRLNQNSPPIARALAMADIGTAGMDSAEAFVQDGVRLFREDNLDVLEDLLNHNAGRLLNTIRGRMLYWSEKQIDFAKGRKELFEAEVGGFPVLLQPAVRSLFTNFDTSIDRAESILEKRNKLPLERLMIEFGY